MAKSVLDYVAALRQNQSKDEPDFDLTLTTIYDYGVMAATRKGFMQTYYKYYQKGGTNMSKPGFKVLQDQDTSDVKPLELYLEDEGNGAVGLYVVNPNTGGEWSIAVLDADGMTLSPDIEDDMIATDKAGRISVIKE